MCHRRVEGRKEKINKCESLIVISLNVSQQEIKNTIEHTEELINKIGEVTSIQYLGVLEPKYNVVGYGFLFGFKTKLEEVEELESYYQENEKIVYDLTIPIRR